MERRDGAGVDLSPNRGRRAYSWDWGSRPGKARTIGAVGVVGRAEPPGGVRTPRRGADFASVHRIVIHGNRKPRAKKSPMETELNHSPADPAGERLRAADVGFLLLAASPFLWNLGALSLWYAEERWLFIVRHMRESGDWLSLVKDGEFYGDKPYFSYWAQAASAALWGGLTEASARFPSALAGIGTVLTTAWIAARTLGRSRARAAGSCSRPPSPSRCSRASRPPISGTPSSRRRRSRPTSRSANPQRSCDSWDWEFAWDWGQSKGIPAIVLPVAVAACDLLGLGFARRRERPWRVFPWLRAALGAAIALAVFVGIYVGPFALAYARTGNWSALELVWRENFVRVLDAFDHRDEGPLFYCYILPAMMAPWTLWVPMAIAFGASRWNRHEGWRFLGLAFAVIFAMFTVSESRRSYYILPAFPWAAILTAGFLHECWEGAEAGAGAWRGRGASSRASPPGSYSWLLESAPFCWCSEASCRASTRRPVPSFPRSSRSVSHSRPPRSSSAAVSSAWAIASSPRESLVLHGWCWGST